MTMRLRLLIISNLFYLNNRRISSTHKGTFSVFFSGLNIQFGEANSFSM